MVNERVPSFSIKGKRRYRPLFTEKFKDHFVTISFELSKILFQIKCIWRAIFLLYVCCVYKYWPLCKL